MMQKRYDDASPHFERAVELDPESSEYALAFARILVLRKREQVLLAFTKSVEPKFGKLPEFQYILGLAYFGVTQFQDAANVLEKLSLNNPSNPDRVYFILGKSYLGSASTIKRKRPCAKRFSSIPKLLSTMRITPRSCDKKVATS